MNDSSGAVGANSRSFRKLAWIMDHSEDGLFLATASPRTQRAVAERYRSASVAIFDCSREQTPFQPESFSQLLQREPGKRAYFFLNFQLAVPKPEDVERLNFCRDILIREKRNLVFFVNRETQARLNRGAMDFYSCIRLILPFDDEPTEASEFLSASELPYDRSKGVTLPAPDFSQPRNKLLSQAIAYGNLGKQCQSEGRFSDAASYCEAALSIRRQLLGENHPDTAETMNQLGQICVSVGQYAQARQYFEQALRVRRNTLGEYSPFTAESCNDLGIAYLHTGDYPRVLEYLEKALAIREKVLGTEHPDTAESYNNIASVYRAMGELPKALEYNEKALAISEKVLGAEHPSTATSYNNIAGVYCDMGELPKALEYLEKALAIQEKVLGTEHPDTAGSYNNIAAVYLDMGDYPKALEYLEKALAIREKLLGAEHPDTAGSYNNIATVYYDMGELPKALEYNEKSLVILENALGREHPYTVAARRFNEYLRSQNNMAGSGQVGKA